MQRDQQSSHLQWKNNTMTRHNRFKLWQHQVCEVSNSNNQMLWPGWVLEAIQTALFLSQHRPVSASLVMIPRFVLHFVLFTGSITKIIFILYTFRHVVLFIVHNFISQMKVTILFPFPTISCTRLYCIPTVKKKEISVQ
jgi:hypothetical protein